MISKLIESPFFNGLTRFIFIRSILFLITYLILVIGKISVITLMPVIAVIIMMLSVMTLSKRENIIDYNNSLENIESVEKIK